MKDSYAKTKHWLFDFDGTLVDSMPYWSSGMTGVLDNHKIPYGEDIVNIITPLGTNGTVEYFIKLGLSIPKEEIFAEISDNLTPKYRDIIPAKEGVIPCLEKMKAAGYRLHILTASPHTLLDPCLKRIGIFSLFDNVWSSDDFGTGKTNPDIYRAAAERIGTTVNNITFLDDNINADKTAKLAGTMVIGVFDETSAHDEEKIREFADGYVKNFSELEKMLSL
jgi:HAD superfamily hydrolase (TIGR01509 family)